jgi:hypothetical protein
VVSPQVKLCAFGLLLIAIFLAARAAGSSLGPVTTVYTRTGGTPAHTSPGMPGMNMFPSSSGRGGTQPSPTGSAVPAKQKEPR